jgi:hypothetical protein
MAHHESAGAGQPAQDRVNWLGMLLAIAVVTLVTMWMTAADDSLARNPGIDPAVLPLQPLQPVHDDTAQDDNAADVAFALHVERRAPGTPRVLRT